MEDSPAWGSPEEIRAQLERYLALVEHAPDAIVILDVQLGRFVSVNKAAEQLLGMSRSALLRVGPVQVSPPVQPDGRPSETAAAGYIAQALAGERPRFEWTHRRPDGRDVACEVTLLRLPSAGGDLIRGSVLDITERRDAELARQAAVAEQAARRAAEAGAARLQAMVAGLNAVVWERDAGTGQVRFITERVEEMLGHPVAAWRADPDLWRRIVHPDDRERVLQAVAEGSAAGRDFTLSYRVHAADGRLVWLHDLVHVFQDDTGERRLHGVLIDITEQKRAEQAAALLAAAGRLLAASGPVEDRLTALAALTVGPLGERASVWLRDDDGRYRVVAAAPAEFAPQVLGLEPLVVPPDLEQAYRAGRPLVVAEVDDDMRRRATHDEAHYEAVRQLGTRTVLVAPLVSGGQILGLLTMVTAGAPRQYDDAALEVAAELGHRVAAMVAAERVATRQRQLHGIIVALSAAGTVAEAAAEVTAGLRTVLAASSVSVSSLGSDGQLHTVDALGYAPDRLRQYATMRLSAPLPITDAARTGRPVWLPDRATLLQRYPAVATSVSDHTQAAAALPLLVGDHVVGAVGVSFDTPRTFDADERTFLLTVAGQVAVAFERAALADVRREMAETLQRSLLPGAPPRLERVAVTASYLPAVQGTRAGGDWYDVLQLDGGRVAVVVGDVVGNGARAAAVMGQLRSALAALLLEGHSPGRALDLLDRFAGHVEGTRVATVACLQLDPDTGRLTYSRAGHPPPLIVDGEGSAFLDGGLGPALGLPGAVPRPEAGATLTPGTILVLYTDGLVERRGATLDDGLDRLATAAARRWTGSLTDLVDGLLDDLVDRAGGTDDIAVVAGRLLPAPLGLEVPAEPERLAGVRRAVQRWAVDAALDREITDDLQLAIGEAVANAVEHAYLGTDRPGRVILEIAPEGDGGLAVTVTDSGTWRPAPADPGFRGRGLQIIRALGSDVGLDLGPEGTSLRFRVGPPDGLRPPAEPLRPAGAGLPDERPAALTATDAQGRRCLELIGDLDLAGVPGVRPALLAELADSRPMTLDLTHLRHVASVGLGLLLEVARTAEAHGADVDVVLPDDGPVRRLLDLTGLTPVLLRSGGAER